MFLNSVVENIPDMIFVKEAGDLRFVRFNKAGEELLGFSRKDLIGKNDYDFFPKDEADFFTRKDREVLAGGKLFDIPEEPIHTRHKGTRYLHTKKIPVLGRDGTPRYLLGISEDITEKKRVLEELKLYGDVVKNTQIAILIWRLEDPKDLGSFRLIAANPVADQVVGTNMQRFVGKPMRESFPHYLETKYPSNYRDVIQKGKSMDFGELRYSDENLKASDWSLRAFPLPNNCVGVALENVTARKQMERQVLNIIGQEQRRIGQDLHDGVGQELAAIALMGKAVEQGLSARQAPEAAKVKEIMNLVVQCIDKTRGLARGLQPVELETNGLQPALEELAMNTETFFKVRCAFEPATALPRQDYDVSLQLYRIAQEAVRNAVKHGNPSRIEIGLEKKQEQLILTIQDNGKGIPDESERDKLGMGIHIMEYRAKTISGALEIQKLDEGGTRVQVVV